MTIRQWPFLLLTSAVLLTASTTIIWMIVKVIITIIRTPGKFNLRNLPKVWWAFPGMAIGVYLTYILFRLCVLQPFLYALYRAGLTQGGLI